MHPSRHDTAAATAPHGTASGGTADGHRASESSPGWSIDALVARSSAAGWRPDASATIRLDHASSGIALGIGERTTMHLLGIVLDPAMKPAADGPSGGVPPADHWSRGDDVVAVYEPSDPRSLRATAMWRRWPRESAGVSAWELVVSCQTSLLESDATVIVRSMLPNAADVMDVDRSTARAWLIRTAAGPSVLVAVHPLDAGRLTVRPAGGRRPDVAVAVECHLFPSRVEKGVLLRGRSLAAVGPRADDLAWAARLLAEFDDSPPPLSA